MSAWHPSLQFETCADRRDRSCESVVPPPERLNSACCSNGLLCEKYSRDGTPNKSKRVGLVLARRDRGEVTKNHGLPHACRKTTTRRCSPGNDCPQPGVPQPIAGSLPVPPRKHLYRVGEADLSATLFGSCCTYHRFEVSGTVVSMEQLSWSNFSPAGDGWLTSSSSRGFHVPSPVVCRVPFIRVLSTVCPLSGSYANVMYSVWSTLIVDPWSGLRRVIRRRYGSQKYYCYHRSHRRPPGPTFKARLLHTRRVSVPRTVLGKHVNQQRS